MSAESLPTAPPPAWSWPKVAAMIALVLGLPVLLAYGVSARRAFDDTPLRLLRQTQPEIVLLGDSMLETRIDPPTLDRVAGRRCHVLAQPGTSSAVWFLEMKNIVAPLEPPPRTVIVFFRARQLTLPAHRTAGRYRKTIESFMQGGEPLFEKLTAEPGVESASLLERLSLAVYPVQKRREAAQTKMQSVALDLVADGKDYVAIRAGASQIFSAKQLRGDNEQDEQEAGAESLDADDHEFAHAVGQSFLPAMLELAKARGMQMIFFQVKRRPKADGRPAEESATAPAYRQALREYLEAHGARLFDETREPDVTRDFYGSGDHVSRKKSAAYTALFWRKIEPLIAAPARAAGEVR